MQADAKRILVWLPNWVGDAVMATPALRALRERFAAARITFIGRPAVTGVLAGLPFADDTVIDASSGRPNLLQFIATVRKVRSGRFDLAVLLPNSFRTAAIARIGGAARVAGYRRDCRGWLLSQSIDPPRDAAGRFAHYPAVDYYADLAAMLGAKPESKKMVLAVSEAEQAQADAMLADAGHDGRPVVMLNPGGAFGPSKMWDPHRYAAVADQLIDKHGAAIVVNAAPSEKAVAAEVAAAMRNRPLINFAERQNSLGLLKALLRRSRLLITNDTGARHVAAALGASVVTIFGSTDPEWTVIDFDRERIVRVNVPCGPCQNPRCMRPLGETHHQCMTAITPHMVMKAAEELLAIPPAGGGA